MTGTLAEQQRRMQAAMGGEPAAGLVHGSPALPAEARLALYRRSTERRLTGCLAESFPALRHALGDELFGDFARDYLAAHPATGPSLATLGAGFPDHLEATRPDRDEPEREPWVDFVIALARLERLFLEVYDGPGTEGARLATPDDVDSGAVAVAPCVRTLRANHAVDAYLLAVRRGEAPEPPPAGPRHLVLSRRDWVVTLYALEPEDLALLEGLRAGEPLAHGERRRLHHWAGLGLLLPAGDHPTAGARG